MPPKNTPPQTPSLRTRSGEAIRRVRSRFQMRTLVGCFVMLVGAMLLIAPRMLIAFPARVAASALLPQDENGNTNILLLGVGDPQHAAAYLTDSIIVASIQPGTHTVSMLSIPRDLYLVDTKDTPHDRINAQYVLFRNLYIGQKHTPEEASAMALRSFADEIGSRLHLQIHEIVKVDFTGFERVIDAFGGVDIDVPEAIRDAEYPVSEGKYGTFSIAKGPQHLDGKTTLMYSRSRHTTNDFDRSGRQQQILRALMQKAKQTNPVTDFGVIQRVLNAVEGHAEWTVSSSEMLGLGGVALSMREQDIVSMNLNAAIGSDVYDAEPGGMVTSGVGRGIASGSILVPASLSGKASDWSQIRTLADLLFTHRELYRDKPVIQITADPRVSLYAHRLRNELLRYGFQVPERAKLTKNPGESTVFLKDFYSGQTAELFAQLTGLLITNERPISETPVISIELGPEYKFVPFEKSRPDVDQ